MPAQRNGAIGRAMSNPRSAILWMLLLLSAIEGGITGILGDESAGAEVAGWILTLLELALIFAWIHLDSAARGFRRTALFNIGIAALAVVFVPCYLYRSRQPGQRRSALLGLLVFVALALGVQWSAEVLTRAAAGLWG